MRLDPQATQDALLRQLEREAEATWGAERLAVLRPTLKATAEALWHLAQQPLQPDDRPSWPNPESETQDPKSA